MNITANFMSSEFVRKMKILLQKKSNVYIVTDINEKSLKYNKEQINQEMKEIRL